MHNYRNWNIQIVKSSHFDDTGQYILMHEGRHFLHLSHSDRCLQRERAHKMGRLGMYICVTFTPALSYEKGVVTRGDIFVVCWRLSDTFCYCWWPRGVWPDGSGLCEASDNAFYWKTRLIFNIKAAQWFHKTSYVLRVKALKSIIPLPQNCEGRIYVQKSNH